jgi:hypothetical protein
VERDRVHRDTEQSARRQVARVEHERRAAGFIDVDPELAVERGEHAVDARVVLADRHRLP